MLPTGIILLWSGAIVDIPAGFVLCDGNNGTPDLRDRFIIGAGGSHAVDAEGGSATHTHTFTGDGHQHTLEFAAGVQGGTPFSVNTNNIPGVGTTDAGNSLPPYYALAYIMKT